MRILSKEEATKVGRPGGMTPWTWPEPAFAAVSDCHRVLGVTGESPLSLAIAVNFFESLYEQGYAIVKLDEEPEKTVVDLQPWIVTVAAVRKTSTLNHVPSVIPAIKALRAVGTDSFGWSLDLAEAKNACDRLRDGVPFTFTVAGETAAKDAKAQLESAGMTVSVSRDGAVKGEVPDENSPGAILADAVHEQWLAEGTE